uniref:hypothetical protein n=1 Tax=Actinomadura sp. CA-154981 TaxID=3240037 RepID=UPI003F49A579
MIALAARDLIGAVPQWTTAAYEALMAPWRAAFAGPPPVVPEHLRSWSVPWDSLLRHCPGGDLNRRPV